MGKEGLPKVGGRPPSGGSRQGSAGVRPGSRTGSRPSSAISFAEGAAPLGRRGSMATEAVNQAKTNAVFTAENQRVIDFLNETNRDYEMLVDGNDLTPSRLMETFTDGTRTALSMTSQRLSNFPKGVLIGPGSHFSNLSGSNLGGGGGGGEGAGTPTPASMQRSWPSVATRHTVQRRSLSVEPLPDLVQRRMRHKIAQPTKGAPPTFTESTGVNLVTGKASLVRGRPRPSGSPKKKKQIPVVTGTVDYNQLLMEQSILRDETAEKEKNYGDLLDNYFTTQERLHRRLSEMAKPGARLLEFQGDFWMKGVEPLPPAASAAPSAAD